VSPFDLKSVFFAKHAQHVVLIHFPIALFTAAVAFDYLGQWTKNKRLATAAYLNIVVAAASTLPVIVTGVMGSRRSKAQRHSAESLDLWGPDKPVYLDGLFNPRTGSTPS
jgi:uncharacterized membrane protein